MAPPRCAHLDWPLHPPVEFAGGTAHPFIGGDLEKPGVLEAALAARAPTGELIFLSVGDTRDHRRQHKDPALRTISIDFLMTLLANLHRLHLHHYLILTTEPLCRKMQRDHCLFACAWTTLWDQHPGLVPWGLKPGDMFLMWAQQWRYVCSALERRYRVLRADTDVYFAEDPYPILHGPLLRPFSMVVQQDFGGPLGGRATCSGPVRQPTVAAMVGGAPASCGIHRGSALLNIGLLYIRSQPGGGAFAVINGTWARFLRKLDGPPYRPKHLNGNVETQALIDQPLMRDLVSELAVADRPTGKQRNQWLVVPGTAAEVYKEGTSCALENAGECDRVRAARRTAAFAFQTVRPAVSHRAISVTERVALSPDWLFGRGCLTHVREPKRLLDTLRSGTSAKAECLMPPTAPGKAMPAPANAAGILVATHFVYSMALKRKRSFRAFAWDDSSVENRTQYHPGSCWDRSRKGILFGHTFFTQMEEKTILCAMPASDSPECSCCTGVSSLAAAQRAVQAETTNGKLQGSRHIPTLEGCDDYQAFWDR